MVLGEVEKKQHHHQQTLARTGQLQVLQYWLVAGRPADELKIVFERTGADRGHQARGRQAGSGCGVEAGGGRGEEVRSWKKQEVSSKKQEWLIHGYQKAEDNASAERAFMLASCF